MCGDFSKIKDGDFVKIISKKIFIKENCIIALRKKFEINLEPSKNEPRSERSNLS